MMNKIISIILAIVIIVAGGYIVINFIDTPESQEVLHISGKVRALGTIFEAHDFNYEVWTISNTFDTKIGFWDSISDWFTNLGGITPNVKLAVGIMISGTSYIEYFYFGSFDTGWGSSYDDKNFDVYFTELNHPFFVRNNIDEFSVTYTLYENIDGTYIVRLQEQQTIEVTQ